MHRERFVRFVILARDASSGKPQGFLHALANLQNYNRLTPEEGMKVAEAFAWFEAHLPTPERFGRSMKAGASKNALSWYRATAREHIRRTRTLLPILHAHGFLTKMVTAHLVGRIVYEDEYQVVAVPHRDTRVA